MIKNAAIAIVVLFLCVRVAGAQEHEHAAPEKLGKVSFPTSCAAGVKARFNRAVALLHSFTYEPAEAAFQEVVKEDPTCAMAHWGIAMSGYRQLWQPPLPGDALAKGHGELELARQAKGSSAGEQEYLAAAAIIFDATVGSYPERAGKYRDAMAALAQRHPDDTEAQIFYALALLSTATPQDKTHHNQKAAAQILEPLYKKYPQHPGLAHYIIHADDNAELAARGERAARDYAQIAPSAPHALHMPSHIYTRLGMWDDSIRTNQKARVAAHKQGDTGEELHAMDYMVYAALQKGRDEQAAAILNELKAMNLQSAKEFKVGYAATAMPVRYAVERQQWKDATQCVATEGAPPQVTALAVWARALGYARSGNVPAAAAEVETLKKLVDQLLAAGNQYWAGQVQIQVEEAGAWVAMAEKKPEDAVVLMKKAADEEDAVEKLPVTPGPVVPAREQLGTLLSMAGHHQEALVEFEKALKDSPGRRGALQGAMLSAKAAGSENKTAFYEALLK